MRVPTKDDSTARRRQSIARLVLVIGLVALGAWIIHGFFEALAWAGVIAIAIAPFYARIEARWPEMRRWAMLPALTTLVVALVVLVPVALGLFRAIAEAQDVAHWFASARDNGIPVPQWLYQLPFERDAAVNWWQAHLATPEGAHAQFARFDNQSLMYHGRMIWWSALHRSVTFFFMLLALFFILRDGEMLVADFRSAGHRLFGPSGERIGRQVVQSVRGTIDGLVLVGIGEGAVMTVAYLALGVPHPILLGVATAVAAMIPFGAALMYVIAAVELVMLGSVTGAIAVVVIGFAVVAVADHWLRPVLIGGATRLPFLWVLIGILGGVETLGLLGLFVGPATMAGLVMMWREFVERGRAGDEAAPIAALSEPG
ncbi:MAG: family transporter [Sphingomonas bacterium]|nr:family transporter [Sphingomonas bacterium]